VTVNFQHRRGAKSKNLLDRGKGKMPGRPIFMRKLLVVLQERA